VIATTTTASVALTAIGGPDRHPYVGSGPIGTMISALCEQIGRSTLMGAGSPRDALELAYDVQMLDRHTSPMSSGLINRRLDQQSVDSFGRG
jgi:hypothetical protein